MSINWEWLTGKVRVRSARFTATFESDCENCGNTITDGDEAGYVDNLVYCDKCCDEADENDN